MFYRKNVGRTERWVRGAVGAAVAGVGLMVFGFTPNGWLALASGLGMALTGVVGFCPACALVGRRLQDHR